jgi:hypothetical protein
MTNIFPSKVKLEMKHRLFAIAVEALEKDGWKVERVQGIGKSSVRRIVKGPTSKLVAIRTSQDTWIAFPRTEGDRGWRTLDNVDAVVAVSVDDRDNPKFAKVHLIDGREMRARFDRAYAARKKAGHTIPPERGIWVSLYQAEADDPVSYVGAGAGLKFPPMAIVALEAGSSVERPSETEVPDRVLRLTIPEAKRGLALEFGVDPSNIKIIIEG